MSMPTRAEFARTERPLIHAAGITGCNEVSLEIATRWRALQRYRAMANMEETPITTSLLTSLGKRKTESQAEESAQDARKTHKIDDKIDDETRQANPLASENSTAERL